MGRTYTHYEIVQVIPTTGLWYAVHFNASAKDDKDVLMFFRIPCWALCKVSHRDSNTEEPMSESWEEIKAMLVNGNCLDIADADNCFTYIHESQTNEPWLLEEAKRLIEKRRKEISAKKESEE